jgi:hypothetical protein
MEVIAMNERGYFVKFTERARKVLSLAQEEAQRFQHHYIGTEHLLLGLAREGQGVAVVVLKSLGVELDTIRSAVEAQIGQGAQAQVREPGLTTGAKKVIELTVDESRRLNHRYVGTEHLLLGLIREGEGIAAGVLTSLGIDLAKARTQTLQVLGQASVERETGPESAARAAQSRGVERLIERGALLAPYQSHHITGEAPDKIPIGKKTQQETGYATMLGWVTVNTGGAFTLTLYQGMASDAPKVAVITDPPTGAYFPFQCLLKRGLAYTLTGTPGSVTVVYGDIPTE